MQVHYFLLHMAQVFTHAAQLAARVKWRAFNILRGLHYSLQATNIHARLLFFRLIWLAQRPPWQYYTRHTNESIPHRIVSRVKLRLTCDGNRINNAQTYLRARCILHAPALGWCCLDCPYFPGQSTHTRDCKSPKLCKSIKKNAERRHI